MPHLPSIALAALIAVGALAASAAPTSTPTTTPPRRPTAAPTATGIVPTLAPVPTATAALPPATATPNAPSQDVPELRAVWVDAFHDGFKTAAQVDDLVAWARQANVNALFVQVRRRGDAYYARSLEPRTEDPDLQPDFDALQYLIERAHQGPRRIQVHAWLATLPIWLKRDTPPLDPGHPFNRNGLDDGTGTTWLMLRNDGAAWAGGDTGGMYYFDPGNPAAARYTVDVALNVVRSYDVDGVHLDQVRYFEGDGGAWGYNPTSVARFNQRRGRDPLSQPDPDDPEWSAWRRDQVTALVRRVYLETKAVKPDVAVTAAVVPWGPGPDAGPAGWQRTAAFTTVFQDWRAWLEQGIVDYVIPMDYYHEADPQAGWFDTWSSWQQANRGTRGVVIGVGTYLNDRDGAMAQLQRARALGTLGVALYSYAVPWQGASDLSPEGREQSATWLRQLFRQPAPVVDLPWADGSSGLASLLVDVAGHDGVPVRVDGPTSRQWLTDGTGSAGGADLPPGQYRLTVVAPDLDATAVVVSLSPGRTTVLRLGPGARAG